MKKGGVPGAAAGVFPFAFFVWGLEIKISEKNIKKCANTFRTEMKREKKAKRNTKKRITKEKESGRVVALLIFIVVAGALIRSRGGSSGGTSSRNRVRS